MLWVKHFKENGDFTTTNWNIGEDTSPLMSHLYNNNNAIYIVVGAYGEELDYIRREFNGLVQSKKPNQVWFGDIARTIISNL
jgi:hypothetical protein